MASETADRHPVLVCTAGALSGHRAVVGDSGLVLGRGEHCDMVIDDPGVSREHARVLMHNDAVWVQDAGSRNGCFVNDRRLVRHKQLGPGDLLRIGQHSFMIELVDPFPRLDSVGAFDPAHAPPVALPPTQLPQVDGNQSKPAVPSLGLLVLVAGVAALIAALVAWLW